MSDIRIDFDRLDRAHSRLTSVIGDFESTSQVQAHLADATGHPQLSPVVADFRTAWSIRRGELVDELRFIDDAGLWVSDLDSTNGVWVVPADGEAIEVVPGTRTAIPVGADLELGDFVIQIEHS